MAGGFCEWLIEPAGALIEQAQLTLQKPYGQNHILIAVGEVGISFACIRPGQGTSLHYHVLRQELFCVHGGTLLLTSGGAERTLGPGGLGWSTPGIPHSLRNGADTDLHVLEMFSPALLEDKVRVSDKYNRALGRVSLHQ